MIRSRNRARGGSGGGGIAPPMTLPTVGASPQAVYGTTILVSGYAGSCLRVNRASDNAQLDIGFVNGRIDMAAANTFRGASEITVVTWYDQSGNGFDATNATVANQPRLRSENAWRGLQGILFDGFNNSSGGTIIAKTLIFPAGVTVDRRNQTGFLVNGVKSSYGNHGVLEIGTTSIRALPFMGAGNTGASILNGGGTMQATRFMRSNPSVNGWRMGASSSRLTIDNTGNSSFAAMTAGTASGGRFGATATGSQFNHKGEIYAFVEYAAELNDTDYALVQAALDSAYSTSYTQDAVIMVEGDSISEGTSDTYIMNNIRQCYPNLITDAHIYNMALHGTRASIEYPRRVAKFDSIDRTATNKIFVLGLGSNDLANNTTGSDLWTTLNLPYIQYAQSRGYDVIVGTVIPRGTLTAPQEVERLAYNALVLANAGTYGYTVADYCAQPEFDSQADASNTTYYFTDTVHPNSTGYGVMANVLYPLINTFL